jgi:4-hydroxymandelate synthase
MSKDAVSLHHVEIFVRDLTSALRRYTEILDFRPVAYGDASTGLCDRTCRLLESGNARLLLTAPVNGKPSVVSEWLERHGEGVAAVTLTTENLSASIPLQGVEGPGSLHHPLKGGEQDAATPLAALQPSPHRDRACGPENATIDRIDHLALVLEHGTLRWWQDHYERTLGLRRCFSFSFDESEEGMRSVALRSEGGDLVLVLVEPARHGAGQLNGFLRQHNGAGVQHLALGTSRVPLVAERLRQSGQGSVEIPHHYYELLRRRHRGHCLPYPLRTLSEQRIVADGQGKDWLLQLFSEDFHPDEAFFLELIERRGEARGFGENNIAMLYGARERRDEELLRTA